jgi:hypothetical protein
MAYPNSYDVVSGDTLLAADHNNLRSDLLHATLGHDHTGAANHGTVVSHASLSNVSANQHHNQAHSLDGADHTAGTQGDVIYAGASGDWALLAAGTSGRVLTTQGAGANPIWARNGARTITASDDLLASLDTQRNTTAQVAYALIKKFTTNLVGIHRVKFDLQETNATNPATAYGRIYKNGVAFGTEQTNGSTWQTFSEDLAFIAGDTIELWWKEVDTNDTETMSVRNFRIYGVIADIELTTD